MADLEPVPKNRYGTKGNPFPGVNILVPDTPALDVSSLFPGKAVGFWHAGVHYDAPRHLKVVPTVAKAS